MPIIDDDFLASLTYEPILEPVHEEREKAFERIVRLVSARERCVSELRGRLLRDGFSEEQVSSALDRAISCGLVDDMRYASILLRSRISQGKGRAGIEEELRRSGISPSGLPGWPEEYFSDEGQSEEERAFELLQRKPPRSKNIYAAACRKLAAQGYASDVVFTVARRYAKHEGLF